MKRFFRFWYEFVVGDDWVIAVGLVVALGATWGLHDAGAPAWWLVPFAVLVLLASSLLRAT